MPRDTHMATIHVRRFEMGASGQGYDDILRDAGWSVCALGKIFELRRNGQKMRMDAQKLADFIDQERTKQGLEPIRKRTA